MRIKKIGLFIGLFLMQLLWAQRSKEDLRKQSAELKKQIAVINSQLAKAKGETKLSITYLNNINQKIHLREKVYRNTQKEKRLIEEDIYLRQLEINKYNRELKVMKEEYAKVLVNAYKNKGVQNKVTFILSSKNLGEALRRVQYLKRYGEYQDKKAVEITEKTAQIKKTIELREKSKKEKETLLLKQNKELEVIAQERKEKEILLEEFKKNEARLLAELNKKKQENKRLEDEIRKIIAEEIRIAKAKAEAERKAREEKLRLAKIEAEKEKKRIEEANRRAREEAERAKRKAEEEERRLKEIARKKAEEERKAIEANNEARRIAAEKAAREAEEKAKLATSKADAARENSVAVANKIASEKKVVEEKVEAINKREFIAGNNFAENRGRMSFPVSSGKVIQRFGRQAHPVYKGVVIESNGIKIAVNEGAKARCVFPGVVVNIMASGGAKTVMVKHGNYFTIYSNLVATNVSKNQKVSAGTIIGEVGTDIDGVPALDFQIWDKTIPVDPLGWINN
ncbi:MAG: peptidoglycan DD-metalloendopeptidase family protein [Flavobacteriaceae bacterium]|nr:peptidoglycan DD-metalloendopeptidase family protein [Flavobacteriaceae bacterium]